MRRLLLPILLLATVPLFAADATTEVKLPPELARVLRDYETAWQAKDAKALAQLFAEDGYVLTGGQPPVRGRAAIEAVYTGKGGPLALRALHYATSGRIGYIIGGYATKAGETDMGKFTLTLRKVGNRWLIQSDMDNANSRPQRRPAD
ncbi:MAG TPA: nuclear transport factor 2 family protein [Thermoanaerobaculia bacterium]|nr:nuclear transport factor 2 family protein [Thermoanaerobaculia bacterium]